MATVRTVARRAWFEIDGEPSHCPAWEFFNVLELYKPAQVRGTDATIIPGAHGRRLNPLWRDGTERVINGRVYGAVNSEGTPYPQPIDGLEANLLHLRNAWASIPATADSSRTCILHLPSGATPTGPVQVRDFDWDYTQMPVVANVVMRLYLPAGELQ